MKRLNLLFFAPAILLLIVACESADDKANAQNLQYGKQLYKLYERDFDRILVHKELDQEAKLVRQLYDRLKSKPGFLGMKVDAWHRCYATSNLFNALFHGERDLLLEDTAAKKEIRYGDFMYNQPIIQNDTLQPIRNGSAGGQSAGNYHHHVPDILVISYGEDEIDLYFKAPHKLKEKFANGDFSRGPTVSTSTIRNVILDLR